jgi:hypothetical protein
LNTPIWLVASDGVHRAYGAAGDALQGGDDVRRRQHRVDGEVRHRAVPAAPAHRDADFVGRGHDRAGAHRELARRQARPVVQPVDLVHREALEEALLHHDIRAAAAFLGRLENDVRRAVIVAGLGEIAGGAEQHGRMAVVAAGVHAPLVARAMRDVRRLVDRQAVHVGAQADGAAARRFAARDHADHTGLGDAAMHLDAQARELVRDDARGARLLEGELGMRMQIAAHVAQLGLIGTNALDRRRHTACTRSRGSTA